MNFSKLKSSYTQFFTSSDIKNFVIIVSLGIVGQIIILMTGILLNLNTAEQLSLEYLFIFTFLVTLLTTSLRYGFPIIALFIIELFIATHEETNSLYNLQTYMYTGFSINLGYQEAIPNLPAGGYPIAIAFAWVFLIYGCYNFTNFLLDGSKNSSTPRLREVPVRVFLDGMFLWQFSLLVEAVGIDLGYWSYNATIIANKNQPTFFGIPMDTLYYYLITALLFNSLLRFGEYFYRNRRPQIDLNWFNGFAPVMFLYFWIYLLLIVLIKFGFYHWAFFVGTPSLFIFSAIFLVRFLIPKLQEENLLFSRK
ncbi:MAG: hypothetical protein ACW981_05040 [Candidatus Hodarchaeales archaeon]|jgi:hypothetical protein